MASNNRSTTESSTWVVVADRSRAKVLSIEGKTASNLHEVATLSHPEGAMKQSEYVSDRQGYFGRNEDALDAGVPQTDYKHKTAEEFALQLISLLESGRNGQQYDSIILIAAPMFLGVLRDKLPAPLEKLVELEIDKDLTRHSNAEIVSQITKLRVTEG